MLLTQSDTPTLAGPQTQLAALLYDLDGTLVNTDPYHFRVWQEMLRDYGLDVDEAFYQSRISGRLNPAIVADLLPQLDESAAAKFIAEKEARFRSLTPQMVPMAGLGGVMEWARGRELKQAVVTNAPVENVHHALQALALESSFDQVVISDLLGIGKPDPTPYLHALEQFEIPAAAAIAFEDSPSGVRSAVAAGIPTVGIASTHDPQVLLGLGAFLVVPDFAAPELWEVFNCR